MLTNYTNAPHVNRDLIIEGWLEAWQTSRLFIPEAPGGVAANFWEVFVASDILRVETLTLKRSPGLWRKLV